MRTALAVAVLLVAVALLPSGLAISRPAVDFGAPIVVTEGASVLRTVTLASEPAAPVTKIG